MRRITMWLIGTVGLVVLLFSYRTSTSGPGAPAGQAAYAPGIVPDAGAGGPNADPGPTTTAQPSPSGDGAQAPGTGNATINGTVADTVWGPVQVQIKVSSRRIVDVVVLQQPAGNRRDAEINGYALPILREQVLQAQSAAIDGVSGATVTSVGYQQSLQSAVSLAHLGG